ncbi:MAG: hypothetical protein WBO09_22455 [Methylocystis silviterrae]|uniref:hypothetical protein n=1 Tax=Methylocystis silviterrae TaxID=2743612 RepID=UPI003C7403A2
MTPPIMQRRVADMLSQAAARLAAPMKQARLSPLSAMILAFFLATTLMAGLFAISAIFGSNGSDSEVAAPDWKPPTLAIGELDPPKPASADVETLSRPIFSRSRRPSPRTSKPQSEADLSPSAIAPGGLTVSAIVKNKEMHRLMSSLRTRRKEPGEKSATR